MKSRSISIMVLAFCLLMPMAAKAQEGIFEGWKGSVFAGYNQANGNTNKSAASLQLDANKKVDGVEYLFTSNMSYSETDNSMDGQKWDALGRLSFDFGNDDRWYNFYQMLVDHDYFADIDYRLTPSVGVGYHIADSEDWKWDADIGLGYRIERHRINKVANDEFLTAVAHTYMKKRVFDKAFVSEDITVYPGLKSGSGTTLRSESVFSNPLTEVMDMELKYILEYNTEPSDGQKKTDTQVIAGLKYKF